MITETVVLDRTDNSWRSVVLTGTHMTIAGMTRPIRIRFGISSVSEGMLLQPEDVLKVEETVYIQPVPNRQAGTQLHTTLYVHKD